MTVVAGVVMTEGLEEDSVVMAGPAGPAGPAVKKAVLAEPAAAVEQWEALALDCAIHNRCSRFQSCR